MRFVTACLFALACLLPAHAQTPLWTGPAPGARGSRSEDVPTITPYPAPAGQATGAAMVIFPGGGYAMLADHEGSGYARWLNAHGIAAFVVRYRLGHDGYHHPVELGDAARSVRWVRAHASELGVDPHRVGVIGSSAGGHLAATLITHFDSGKASDRDPVERESSRPDLAVLCYPVITMGKGTHQGSRENLLGRSPSDELVRSLSAELQVTGRTPPCFIWTTVDDNVVPVENSQLFARALESAHVPFELHLYEHGPHGQGLGNPLLPWTTDCLAWLGAHGWLKR